MSALAISPATGILRAGGQLTFVASGGSGSGYAFSFANPGDNASGATLNSSTGAYVAGPKTLVEDVVTVTDSASATATASVSICSNLYRNYQSGLVRTPDWQGPRIKLLEADLGTEKDVQFERARQGVLSNNPATCPDDALSYIGQERQLPQAVSGETTDDYRERLRTAWDSWAVAGSHGSLLFALQRAGFPQGDPNGAHIMQRINLYSWLAAGVVTFGTHPIWTFDGSPPNVWNQFGIVFGADVSGLTAGSQMAATLNQLVALWKPAKARFMGTWIIVSGPTWGWPPGTVWGGAGLTWGGGVTRFIPPM
ncbi:MAG TPA: hypothetical protein VHG72_14115 [Polyangia bacterium]|nr:hypothetical protein [Polyangia bacterium]